MTGPIPDEVIIQGLGTGGFNSGANGFEAYHFSISDTTGAGTFWTLSGQHSSGGTYLRNLAFQWVSPGHALDTCLNFNYWSNGAQECTFTDCPTAINFQSLSGFAKACTIKYGAHVTTPANVTAIIVQANQNQISGPSEMDGGGLYNAMDPSANTSTCVLIGGGPASCEHTVIQSVHIYGWNYGIDYADVNNTGIGSGTTNDVIDGCKFDCIRSCINLVPKMSGKIFNQIFSNNTMIKSQSSIAGDPIVYIDCNLTDGGVAANIGPIFLVNNLIYSDVNSGAKTPGMAQTNQYGVQIGTCEAVSIIGGQISNVGTKTQAGSDGTANICISGNPVSVIISDVNLAAAYAGVNSGSSLGTGSQGSAASEFALLITGQPSYVQVDNCYMGGGWAGSPVGIEETAALPFEGHLIITNCIGYNDQNTNIVGNGTVSTATPYNAANAGIAFSGTAVNYYGPSFVMFKANASGGTFQYNGGTAQTLLASQVVCLTLASPYDTIQFNTHAPAAFAWTGT